ncbi:MAG: hypothetical protein HRU15_19730, partial [Planctomycetes bacterium]|nr:hypothetical protein [Planctomycetota bacterium]
MPTRLEAAPSSTTDFTIEDIQNSLALWWQASQSEIIATQDSHLIYGTGYNTWGVQTQQKAIAAVAHLTTHA